MTETTSSVMCMKQTIARQDQHMKHTAAQSYYKQKVALLPTL
jgi:hypothetical protein